VSDHNSPGSKGKLITAIDNVQAQSSGLKSLYTIELALTRSPQREELCGAIVVFKQNVKLDLPEGVPMQEAMQQAAKEQTEVMLRDPEKFRESAGQWIAWAVGRVMEIYHEVGGAKVVIKAPKLKVRQSLSQATVAAQGLKPAESTLRRIDQLLRQGYTYDPWTKTIRRGAVNAGMAKR